MSYQLIIAEKPKAAEKVAESLADKKAKKTLVGKVPYYELKHKGKNVVVCCAVGHLYTLTETKKTGMHYPTFNLEWKEINLVRKNVDYIKGYLDVIKRLSKKAKDIIVACDYDIEGEVIGWNIVRFACNKKDAYRMKFSTLTKDELIESFEKKSKHLDWGQAYAGETRHYLDYYYGINLSRALTSSIKTQNAFKLMSSGRVQGPALKIIVEREKEIMNFKSKPFWLVEFKTKDFSAWHINDKFWKKPKFKLGSVAVVEKITKKESFQKAPFPFDLTSLQIEAYKVLGITPKQTLSIAQELYTDGAISYPRTSSQKLPSSINYKKILKELAKQSSYKRIVGLLPSKLIPREGKKIDSAHPAIYPTGLKPKKSNRLYDLIVHRFLACFGSDAKRESVRADLDIGGQKFFANGVRTIEKGWHELYGKYAKYKEEELPKLVVGDKIKGKGIVHNKHTEPPNRFSQASIIKKLESLGLGTKATRASIVDALYQRDYVDDKSIKATELGIEVINILDKYSPDILDSELTREFEEEMEKVRDGKIKEETVLKRAQKVLISILKKFKYHEKAIGKELLVAVRDTQKKMSIVGPCPNCKGNLVIKRSRFGLFVACDQYPKCKTTFSLPKKALIKVTGKVCKGCGTPEVLVIRQGKRPFNYCLNLKCKLKESWGSKEDKKEESKTVKGKVKELKEKVVKKKVVKKKQKVEKKS